MVFKSIHEAREWFLDYKPYTWGSLPLMYHNDIEYKPAIGDWVLFRHIKNETLISRPIVAMFIEWDVWDMAIVMRFLEQQRAWEYYHKVVGNNGLGEEAEFIIHRYPINIQDIQFWTDDIHIIGTWDKRPNWKQLKVALQATPTMSTKIFAGKT